MAYRIAVLNDVVAGGEVCKGEFMPLGHVLQQGHAQSGHPLREGMERNGHIVGRIDLQKIHNRFFRLTGAPARTPFFGFERRRLRQTDKS